VSADPAAIQSVGQLVQARETRGLAQSDLAARLGMVSRQIQAIERGDWRALPGRSFARSALRAYGRAVSVNVESLLVAIDAEYGVDGEPISRPALDKPMPRRGVLGFSVSGSGSWLAWTILAAVGLVVIAFFFGGGASLLDLGESNGSANRAGAVVPDAPAPPSLGSGPARSPSAPILGGPVPSAAGPTTGPSGLANSLPPSVSSGELARSAGGETPGSSVVQASGVPGSAAQAAGKSEPSSVRVAPGPAGTQVTGPSEQASGADSSTGLVLRFSASSWIEIRDAGDRVVAIGTQPAGTSRSFDIAPPLSGVIGNAGAVAVTWRGEPFDLTPFLRQGVARFRIERGDR